MKVAALLFALAALPATALAQTPSGATPTTPLGRLIASDDYPVEAMRKGEQGTVRFRVTIGTDGRVTQCTVTQSSGSKTLDDASCRIMTERARFTPARDRNGQPAVGTYESVVSWRMDAAPRVDTASTLWVNCVMGAAANSVGSTLTSDEIAARAFAACAESERLMEQEMTRAALPGMVPSTAIAGLKQQFRTRIGEQVAEWRKALESPAARN